MLTLMSPDDLKFEKIRYYGGKMLKPKMVIMTAVLITIISVSYFTLCGCGGDKNAIVAKIADCKGTVTVNGQAASKEKDLKAKDIVEVGKDSFAHVKYLKEGYELMLYFTEKNKSNSKCEIQGPSDEGKTFVVNLMNGLLTFFVPPKDKRDSTLKITADDAIISIHQTKGKVDNSQDNLTVALVEGKVSVNIGGKDNFVLANQQFVLDKNNTGKAEVKPYNPNSANERNLYSSGGSAEIMINN